MRRSGGILSSGRRGKFPTFPLSQRGDRGRTPSSSSYSSPGGGFDGVDRPTFAMPVRTKPSREPDAGADSEAPEAKMYPSATKAAAVAAAPAPTPPSPLPIPLDQICNPKPPGGGYDMFSTWSNSQNKIPPTARWDDPFGWASGDLAANSPGRRRQAIAHQKQGGGSSDGRDRPDAEEEEEEEAMGYWTVASIGRTEIVPPDRSAPGSSSGRRRGSSDSLPPDEDEEASSVEARGEEEGEEEEDWTIPSAGP